MTAIPALERTDFESPFVETAQISFEDLDSSAISRLTSAVVEDVVEVEVGWDRDAFDFRNNVFGYSVSSSEDSSRTMQGVLDASFTVVCSNIEGASVLRATFIAEPRSEVPAIAEAELMMCGAVVVPLTVVC